jgi:hypothetical protein
MAQLTFDGVDAQAGTFRYRGGLGAEYIVHADSASTVFKFTHGTRIRFRRGPHATRGPVVVIGTTGTDGVSLLVHDESTGHGLIIANCPTYADLTDKHDPELVPAASAVPHNVEATGALGFRYAFNTDPTMLETKYGLFAGARVYFSSLESSAAVVGEFLNVLWVTHERNSRAVPLIGGSSESALLHLHGMRDEDVKTGATSPRTPRTPGRNRAAPAFVLDAARNVAMCQGAFGARIEVATDAASLKPFGVQHGQRLLATKGMDEGKAFTIVGVKSGSLYVHVEGDRRVSVCRNCSNAADLDTLYGFGIVTRIAHTNGAASQSSKPAQQAPSRANSVSPKKDESLSPRQAPGAEPRPCWTAHGRVLFDISAKACSQFGYTHGQMVQATKGGDRGTIFYVYGVRNGNLWVIPQGSSRATALRHCMNKLEVDQAYGFHVIGKMDLTPFYQLTEEPGKTPLSSPRRLTTAADFSQSAATPLQLPTALNTRGLTNFESADELHQPQPPRNAADTADSAPRPVVPKIALGSLAQARPPQHPAGPVYTIAPDTTPSTIPPAEVGTSASLRAHASTDPDAPFVPGQMPATRYYLKAYAHLKLGHGSVDYDPLAFHGFYASDPHKRIAAAMASLPPFASHWRQFEQSKRRVALADATTAEMLAVMRNAAHLFVN